MFEIMLRLCLDMCEIMPQEPEKSIQSCCSPKTADKLFFDHNLNMSDDNITCVNNIL